MACRPDVITEINSGPTRTARSRDSGALMLGEPARDETVTVPPMAQNASSEFEELRQMVTRIVQKPQA